MFRSEPQAKRPVLLMLVFGILLVVVGITATAQAVMVAAYASNSTLNSIVESDVATIRGFVHQTVDDLGDADDPAAVERINAYLATLLAKGEIAHAEIRSVDGRVIASSAAETVGSMHAVDGEFAVAVAGSPSVGIYDAAEADAGRSGPETALLREYLPLRRGETTELVIGIWRDAAPVLSQLDGLRRDVVIVTLTGAGIAAAVLLLVFRSAQKRINRQTVALVEATQLDALTGMLNHGALVGQLASLLERARSTDAPVGVALIDIDNFRLLNDIHGHRAGDEVLLLVAQTMMDRLPAGSTMGRYGPDEFLVVLAEDPVPALLSLLETLRAELSAVSVQFDTTERLPVTVSAGIAVFPDNADSVTELLATTAASLHEAKASGGDVVKIAGTVDGDPELSAANFDVFQSLVIAVDTKDRYTKRHSEDVSRYGTFLARRLGLDDATVEMIRAAGLLHDIGKIGIPDAILRKPGHLTADEFEVVKQHVALGDMMVRGLPDVEEIRAGIRHHHERWDGRGYLHALAGEDIPLVARILAVGDAFSAMTTTRPYRKALDVREALTRLGDAAGTQLDENLVSAFILGIETAPDAPLPGADAPGQVLWRPHRRVA